PDEHGSRHAAASSSMSGSSPTPPSFAACSPSTPQVTSKPTSICAPRSPAYSPRATFAHTRSRSLPPPPVTARPRRSPRFAIWQISLRSFHAGDAYDLRPFRHLLGDDGREFLRARHDRLNAELREARAHLGQAQPLVDCTIELVD